MPSVQDFLNFMYKITLMGWHAIKINHLMNVAIENGVLWVMLFETFTAEQD